MISRGGAILRAARRKAGLTQRALAERAHVPQPTIAAIETGRQDPRFATLDTLLRACGYDVEMWPASTDGVDRGLLRQMLRLSPTERLEVAEHNAHELAAVRGAAVRRGRS